METKRYQVDLTVSELSEMERLATFAGMKTKRELITNALTLYRWAANELLFGRMIGSMDRAGGHLKQFDMPSLAAFSQAGEDFARQRPSEAELDERAKKPGRSLREVLQELERKSHVPAPGSEHASSPGAVV